jgi:uncharacterized OsmC-like protein
VEIHVRYEGGTRFSATCGSFTVYTGRGDDGDPGKDGMYPAQLFAASLGMCVGGYVLSYCQHHDIPYQDLTVEVDRETARGPSRTTKVAMTIKLAAPVSEKDADAILKVADRCHITNSICEAAEVVCRLESGASQDG